MCGTNSLYYFSFCGKENVEKFFGGLVLVENPTVIGSEKFSFSNAY